MWMWDGMGPMGWWSWLFLLLLLAGVAVLAVVLVRVMGTPGADNGRRRDVEEAPVRLSARQILDERFARGEIDAAEYDERRSRLEGRTGGDPE